MKFNSIMHLAFFTDQFDVIRDFYETKLGCKVKMLVKNKVYLDSENERMKRLAEDDPDGIFLIYYEIAPEQFIEFFPKMGNQGPHSEWNENLGYAHFALLVDDIYETRDELIAAGVEIDTAISKGPSGTYKMWIHDPDGNRFEIMQYTEESQQLKGMQEKEAF